MEFCCCFLPIHKINAVSVDGSLEYNSLTDTNLINETVGIEIGRASCRERVFGFV